jgi:hypothetical protein
MTSSLFASDILTGLNGQTYSPCGALFPIEGTVYPGAPNPPSFIAGDNGYWCGFASGVAGGVCNAQDGLWATPTWPRGWSPNFCGVGYPAVTTPMWPSVQTGRANIGLSVGQYASDYYKANNQSYDGMVLVFSAWSQGVMALLQWFFNDVVPVTGFQHELLPYIYRLYCFGDPFRCPGIAHGNELAGMPTPPKLDSQVTGGIAGPLDYTVDQANMLAPDGKFLLYSFVNPNDLYADSPCGSSPWTTLPSVGSVEYLFFQIIMQPSALLILKLATLLAKPIGDVEALINTGEFFAAGNNAGHYQYFPGMAAAVDDCVSLGLSLPHTP